MADVFHLPPTARPTGVGTTLRRLVREPEITELRAFCAAAALGSIAEAARALNVSGPALSKRLRALETVAGAQLLERSPRGVTLTSAGRALYGPARRLLSSADSVQALMERPTVVEPVKLASSPTIAAHRLPAALVELAGFEPGLSLELLTANSRVVRELVCEGRADLGVAALAVDQPAQNDLNEKVVWRDEIVLAVPTSHPWADREEIAVEDLIATPLIQPDPSSSTIQVVVAALARLGLQLAGPLAQVGTATTVLQLAVRSGSPALVSQLVAQESELVIRRVAGLRFDREFAVVWAGAVENRRAPVAAVLQHLIDLPFARSRRAQRLARQLSVPHEA